MISLLALAIRAFRRLRPDGFRTRCIFRESCSRRVEREAVTAGFVAAMRVFAARYRECRGGYAPVTDGRDVPTLRLASGRVADPDELEPAAVDAAFAGIRCLEASLNAGEQGAR